jgi:glutaredoxin 3
MPKMSKIQIYTTAICPYCQRAKQLLNRKGVSYEEISIDDDPEQMRHMVERSQRRTVPQIFIGTRHVGGYDDLVELDTDEALDDLLIPFRN